MTLEAAPRSSESIGSGPGQNTKPRILYATEFLTPDSQSQAFAMRSASLAGELVALGFEVTLLSVDPPLISHDFRRNGGALRVHWRLHALLKRSIITRPLRSILLGKLLNDTLATGGYHRILASFQNPVLEWTVSFVSKLRNVDLVFDCQDSWLYSRHVHAGRMRNRIRMFIEGAALRSAWRVTAVTPTLLGWIVRDYHLQPNHAYLVYNAANPTESNLSVSKDIDIIHLGSPRATYDTMAFIDALQQVFAHGLRPRVVFLGSADDEYVSRIRARVVALGLTNHIEFLPQVPHADVPHWLSRSRIGVFTLPDSEASACAIGSKVFEYLASGVPIAHLGPPDGETYRLVETHHCGRTASNSTSFAAVLEWMLAHPDGLRKLESAGRIAAAKYSWNASGRAMARVLQANADG